MVTSLAHRRPARALPALTLTLPLAVAGGVLVVGACERSDAGRPAQTTTTGWVVPRPEATGTTKHTIDNTGFIDNGGRSSEMTTRSEMSGMRATEAGGERPTGTPGSGFPLPIPPSDPPRSLQEALEEGARSPTASPRGSLRSTSAPSGLSPENAYRVARARCDRETACSRVGAGRTWATQDSCVTDQRERVGADFASLSCPRGFGSVELGACLNAVRVRPCTGGTGAELENVSQCLPSALCAE